MLEAERSYSGSPEHEKHLDIQADFQNFWRRKTKVSRLDRFLVQAFRDLVEGHRLYELLRVEHGPGEARLTLGNLWRLTRVEGRPEIMLHTFDLKHGQWREQDPAAITWREYDERALPNRPDLTKTIWPVIDCRAKGNQAGADLYLNFLVAWREKILSALGGKRPAEEERLGIFVYRRLIQLPSKQPAQVLNAALHRHIWDPEFLSLLFPLRVHYDGRVPLSLYLAAQPHREALARISRETPNLLPLLNFIPPEAWPRRDLWQDRVMRASGPIFRQMSARALGWLRQAPAEILGYFHHSFMKTIGHEKMRGFFYHVGKDIEKRPGAEEALLETAEKMADILAELSPQAATPPELAKMLIHHVWTLLTKLKKDMPVPAPLLTALLARLLARHITAIWDSGVWNSPTWSPIASGHSSGDVFKANSIADWFIREGCKRRLPDKNSTWLSLMKLSDQWHEERRDQWHERLRSRYGAAGRYAESLKKVPFKRT